MRSSRPTPRRIVRALVATAVAVIAATALPSPATAATPQPDLNKPVLLVHGIKFLALETSQTNCNSVFGTMKSSLQAAGYTRVYTVGFYANDVGCDLYVPGRANNTLQTSIWELGSELASLISTRWQTSSGGTAVDIVGASMGGLITRAALAGVEQQRPGFPSRLKVEDVLTLSTPHGGYNLLTATFCSPLYLQCRQMFPGSTFLAPLLDNPQGRNPGGSVRTEWTLLASVYDPVVTLASQWDMGRNGATRPPVYLIGVDIGLAHASTTDTQTLNTARYVLGTTGA